MFLGFAKQTKKQLKQIDFRFISVRNEKNLIVSRTPYSHVLPSAVMLVSWKWKNVQNHLESVYTIGKLSYSTLKY